MIGAHGFGVEILAQQAKGAAHAPDGHAHTVYIFDILAGAAARLQAEHAHKFAQQDFAGGLSDGVVGADRFDLRL